MLFEAGDLVYYKKWFAKVKFTFPENKSYIVTLFDYAGFKTIDRQVDQHDLILMDDFIRGAV